MRLLVTGASGQLGAYLLRELQGTRHEVAAWSGSLTGDLFGFPLMAVDVSDEEQVGRAIRQLRPEVIIHTAALANVAACFRDKSRAARVNQQGTLLMVNAAGAVQARFLYVSTDLVFDGHKGNYDESDSPNPLSFYGFTKYAAEQTCQIYPHTLIVRLSLLFGPSLTGRASFFDQQIQALRDCRPLRLFADEWRTPLSLPAAARILIGLAQSEDTGLVHVGGPERLSRLEMGQKLAQFLHQDPAVFISCRRAEGAGSEPRPRDTSLNCGRWRSLYSLHPWPTLAEALQEMTYA